VLNVFMNGLSSDIGTMLRTKELNNLTKPGTFAMQEEKIGQVSNARHSLYKNTATKFSPLTPTRRPVVTNTNTLVPSQQPKTCNYCNKLWHVISECRNGHTTLILKII
jgi:hypothetical protein